MKPHLLMPILLLLVPLLVSASPEEAITVADRFVQEHGLFGHRDTLLTEVNVFRTGSFAGDTSASFVYVAMSFYNGRLIHAKFVVTVDTRDMSVQTVRVLPKLHETSGPTGPVF